MIRPTILEMAPLNAARRYRPSARLAALAASPPIEPLVWAKLWLVR